jgi:polyhydroxyalkanoate synthesis regulator phasin
MSELGERDQISRLFDELAEAALHNKEEAREVLEQAGKSPEEVRKRGRAFIQRVSGKVNLARAEQKKSKVDELRNQVQEYIQQQVEKPARQALAEIMAGMSGESPQFHFRKIEDLSEEDALEMLDEVELLRILEKRGEDEEQN